MLKYDWLIAVSKTYNYYPEKMALQFTKPLTLLMGHRRNFVRRSVSPANAEPSHFFRIILPGTIRAQNLRIPKEFVRRFENELSSEATIGVPDGRVWKMELKKSENEVCFCKGWREFAKHYSISFGFFLVFKYEGNSQFSVMIFDSSAAEIYYPCKDNSEKHNSESEPSGKRPNLNHCGYNVRCKRPKLEDEEEIINIDGVNSRKHEKNRSSGRCRSLKMSKKQRVIEAAQNFKPEKPSFTAIIKPPNLIRCYMDMPITFSRPYLEKIHDSVKLQDCNGKRWVVNCSKRPSSTVRMYGGWINFARANNLKIGDVCVFELIEKKHFVFKVTIFTC